jgi:ornithine cyclodeaminase
VLLLVLAVLVGGLLLNLTPCVLPMIPINIAIIGAGVQARLQLKAAHLVRPFETALIWSPDSDLNAEAATWLRNETGADVRVAARAEEVVRESQLVVTTTPARQPVVMSDWLHPGLHITCMGSDQDGKNEVDPKALERADLYVCDRVSQCAALGELRTAREAGILVENDPPELGQIITGAASGRGNDADITICDLTGTGAQDTAIANFALDLMRAVDLGTRFAR